MHIHKAVFHTFGIVNSLRACSARVTVVGCVCLSVCLSVCPLSKMHVCCSERRRFALQCFSFFCSNIRICTCVQCIYAGVAILG